MFDLLGYGALAATLSLVLVSPLLGVMALIVQRMVNKIMGSRGYLNRYLNKTYSWYGDEGLCISSWTAIVGGGGFVIIFTMIITLETKSPPTMQMYFDGIHAFSSACSVFGSWLAILAFIYFGGIRLGKAVLKISRKLDKLEEK